jgi:hypothetical protein
MVEVLFDPPSRKVRPVRLSEELARILPGRRHAARRPDAPREIIPTTDDAGTAKAERLDAARERLRRQIPPRSEDE